MDFFPSLWRWVWALGALWLITPAVTAEPMPEPATLIAEVLRSHPSVIKAQHNLEAAQATLDGSRAQPNPTLTLAATAGDAGESSNALTQSLEISGQPRLRYEQSQARVEAATLWLQLTRRQVASQVYRAWLELWEKQHLAILAGMRVHLMSEMVRVTQRRYEVGEIPQNESLRVELAATEAEAALALARADLGAAAASLRLLRGLPPTAEPEPLPVIDPEELLATLSGPTLVDDDATWSLEATLASAEGQLELQALRQEQKALLLTAELTGKELSPQLGLSVYRSRFFGNSFEQGAQLSLSWPIFDWGSVSARKRSQLSHAKAQLAEVDEKTLAARQSAAQLWNRWQAARTVRDLLTTQAARYEELARESRIGYDLGMLSLTDVLQTETAFRQAGVDLISAQTQIRRFELDLLEQTNFSWPQTLLEEQ